jgi:hypothetical protein
MNRDDAINSKTRVEKWVKVNNESRIGANGVGEHICFQCREHDTASSSLRWNKTKLVIAAPNLRRLCRRAADRRSCTSVAKKFVVSTRHDVDLSSTAS